VLAIVAVQLWSLVRVVRKHLSPPRGVRSALATVGPLTWELGVSVAILLAFPSVLGMTWQQGLRSIPDLMLVLLVISMLWLVTGVSRSIRLLHTARRARQTSSLATVEIPIRLPRA